MARHGVMINQECSFGKMTTVEFVASPKKFGPVRALSDVSLNGRVWGVRHPARSGRVGQDHYAVPDLRYHAANMPGDARSAAATSPMFRQRSATSGWSSRAMRSFPYVGLREHRLPTASPPTIRRRDRQPGR